MASVRPPSVCTLSLCLILLTWTTGILSSVSAEDYPHSLYLDQDKNYHLSWRFNSTDIEFKVRVNTIGYVGFGISPKGSMKGADIFIGGVSPSNTSYSGDYHGIGNQSPVLDSNNNWHLISAQESDGQTVLVFSRTLISNDNNDISITESTQRVIWAYGSTDDISYHGTKKGTKSLYLLQMSRPDPIIPNDAIPQEFKMNKTLVPGSDTTYWCKSFAIPKHEKNMQIIEISPIVEPGNEQLVHHMLLYGCFRNSSLNESIGHEAICYSDNMPYDWEHCRAVVYGWAIGGSKLNLPEHVGLSYGTSHDPVFYLLEIHYDNPLKKTGMTDSSGVKMIIAEANRTYDAGFMEVGYVVNPDLMMIPPYASSFKYSAYCLPYCEQQMISQRRAEWNVNGVKIIAAFLHAHLMGRKILLHHYRNGIKLPDVAIDTNYDFNYQEIRMLKDEVTFLQGDTLHLECFYDSTDRKTFSYSGESTRNEMCLAFLVYYPKVKLTNCLSVTYPVTSLDSVNKKELERFKNASVLHQFEMNVNGEPNINIQQYCFYGDKFNVNNISVNDFIGRSSNPTASTSVTPIVTKDTTLKYHTSSVSVNEPLESSSTPTASASVTPIVKRDTTLKQGDNSAPNGAFNVAILFVLIVPWML